MFLPVSPKQTQWLLWLSLLAAFLAILSRAAIYEDAYITYRVVENFLNGHGFRWNLDERVQAYTNPLWMILHIPFEAVFHNIYYVSMVLCFASVAATFAFSWRVHASSAALWACFFVSPFIFSKTLAIYSTSGFENPLLHALFAAFVWMYWRSSSKYRWFYLSLFTALSMVTRLDAAVFYLPFWAVFLLRDFKTIPLMQLIIGGLPIAMWEVFSLFYYGFLLPNTAYAKLSTGIEQAEHLRFGVHYILNLFAVDITSALLLLVGVLSVPLLLRKKARVQPHNTFYLCMGLSIFLYTLYVVWAGGTYLSGRLLSLPILASLYVVCHMVRYHMRVSGGAMKAACVLLLFGVVTVLFYPPDLRIRQQCKACFVGVDVKDKEDRIQLMNVWGGREDLPVPGSVGVSKKHVVLGSIGRWGYLIDPKVKIIDPIAISDPLLSRLPCRDKHITTTGMFYRAMPRGYIHAALTGDIRRMPRALGQYYKAIRHIVSGPLWSMERIHTIIKFNVGHYDKYRDRYAQRKARQAMSRRQKPSGQSMKSTAR